MSFLVDPQDFEAVRIPVQ